MFEAYNAFLRRKGLPEERRLHCHAQGYDTVERPLARYEETLKFAPGMNVGIHPGFGNQRLFMTVCDNYLIGADGAPERLHKTPSRIFTK